MRSAFVKTFASRAVAALLTVGAAGVATVAGESPAHAQEIQLTGPLKGAPAVRNLRLYREGRITLAPAAGFTLLDEYRRAIFVGGKVHYNIKEWLSVGVFGAYALGDIVTDVTSKIDESAPRDVRTQSNVAPNKSPVSPNFIDQTARMTYFINPEVHFIPFRGKLALFEKIFVDADAFLHAGAAFIGVEERQPCGAAGQVTCSDPASFTKAGRLAVAPTFGLGFTFYPSDLVSFSLEWKAFPFAWNRAGYDSRGGPPDGSFPDQQVNGSDATFAFNNMFGVTVGFAPQKRLTSD
jgi:hypothetical protein